MRRSTKSFKVRFKMKKIIIPIIFFAAFSGACKKNPFVERVYSIKIQNNSSHWINFFDSRVYPDTLLPTQKPYYGASRPNNFGSIDSKMDWIDVFTNLPKDTLAIFIISADTLQSYNWATIRTDYKILRRYDLSFSDLKNGNFVVTYP